jgi:hypothetical protein
MLLAVCAALLVCALAVTVIAWLTLRICRRLGVDPVAVLLWFGVLERPLEVPRRHRRRRLAEVELP